MATKRVTIGEQIRRTLTWVEYSLDHLQAALAMGDHALALAQFSDLQRLARILMALLPYERMQRILQPARVLTSLLETLSAIEDTLYRNARIADHATYLLGQAVEARSAPGWDAAVILDYEQSERDPGTIVYWVGDRWVAPDDLRRLPAD